MVYEGSEMLKNLKGERFQKVLIESCFGWLVNQEGYGRGEGYNQIYELSFWHPGGTTDHKNKTLSEN